MLRVTEAAYTDGGTWTSFSTADSYRTNIETSDAGGPFARSGLAVDNTEASKVGGAKLRLAEPVSGEFERARNAASPQKDRAEGSVATIEQDFVLCNIKRVSGPVQIKLPKTLFDFDISLGTPIYFSVVSIDGYRAVKVERRSLDGQNERLYNELDALISSI